MKDWAKIIAGLSVAVLVWFVLSRFSSTAPVPAVAGWDDLALCSELISFDGKKTLSLSDDGTVLFDDNSGAQRLSKKGEWKLETRPGIYIISFDDERLRYERIAPEGWDSCMLISGTSVSADLQHSWFAVAPEQEQDPPQP